MGRVHGSPNLPQPVDDGQSWDSSPACLKEESISKFKGSFLRILKGSWGGGKRNGLSLMARS